MAEIDSLSIEIGSNAENAVGAIDRLQGALGRLKNEIRDMRSLSAVSRGIGNIAEQANHVTASTGDNISRLADALGKMRDISDMKISSSIASQMGSIATASQSLNGLDWTGVQTLAANLAPLQNIQKATDLNSVANTLRKLPESIDKINQIDPAKMHEFSQRIDELLRYMQPLANEMRAVSAGFSALPSNIQRAIQANQRLTESNQQTKASFGSLLKKVLSVSAVYYGLRRLFDASMKVFEASNDYIESINLAQVAMGDASGKATEYAEKVERIAGINMTEWISQMGSFTQVINGLGVANERAANMSQQLVQLGYDIQSAFNIKDLGSVMQALQSGITGQIKAMRQYGVELSVAAMKQYALDQGITTQWKNMTSAEQVALRYSKIMHDTANIQGDLARTIVTPSNSLRILNSQWEIAKRSMGQVVSVIATQVIPWVQAAVVVINNLAQALAKAWGFSMPSIDYSGMAGGFSDIADEIEETGNAASGAGGKMKNLLADFDELNVITSQKAGSGGGGLSLQEMDQLYGLTDYTYDFLGGIDSKVNEITTNLENWIKRFVPAVLGVLGGIAAYRLIDNASKLLSTLKGISELKFAQIALGVGLSIAGITLQADAIGNIREEGFTWENVTESIIGHIGTAIGGKIIAGAAGVKGLGAWQIGFGLSLITDAVAISVTGINNAKLNGFNTKQAVIDGVITALTGGIGTGLVLAGAGVATPIVIALGAVVGITAGIATVLLEKSADYSYLASQAFNATANAENGFSVGDMLTALQAEMAARTSDLKLTMSVYTDAKAAADNVQSLANKIKKLNNAAFGKGAPDASKIAELREAWSEFDSAFVAQNTAVDNIIFQGLNTVINGEIETLRGQAEEIQTLMYAITNGLSVAEAQDAKRRDEILGRMAEGTATDAERSWYNTYMSIQSATEEQKRAELAWNSMFDDNGMMTAQIDYGNLDELTKFYSDAMAAYTDYNNELMKSLDAQKYAVEMEKIRLADMMKLHPENAETYRNQMGVLDDWLSIYEQSVSESTQSIQKQLDSVFTQSITQAFMGMEGKDINVLPTYLDEYIYPMIDSISAAYRSAGLNEKADEIESFMTRIFDVMEWGAYETGEGDTFSLSKFLSALQLDKDSASSSKYFEYAAGINEIAASIALASTNITQMDTSIPAPDVTEYTRQMIRVIEFANTAGKAIANMRSSMGMSSSFTPVAIPEIPQFASGGFPKAGSLFFANERGPEMVGTMGGQTAVANQQEIVSGIRDGVADANGGVEARLETLIEVMRSVGNNNNGNNTNRTVRPNAEFGRFVQQSLDLYARGRG